MKKKSKKRNTELCSFVGAVLKDGSIKKKKVPSHLLKNGASWFAHKNELTGRILCFVVPAHTNDSRYKDDKYYCAALKNNPLGFQECVPISASDMEVFSQLAGGGTIPISEHFVFNERAFWAIIESLGKEVSCSYLDAYSETGEAEVLNVSLAPEEDMDAALVLGFVETENPAVLIGIIKYFEDGDEEAGNAMVAIDILTGEFCNVEDDDIDELIRRWLVKDLCKEGILPEEYIEEFEQ